jgi:protein FrlC
LCLAELSDLVDVSTVLAQMPSLQIEAHMKLSFLTYLFRRYPLEYAFKMGQEYGFDGIEIWGGRPHAYCYDMDKNAVADIVNWKMKYGLEISMFVPEILSYPYNMSSRIANERKDAAQYLLRSVEVAAMMGTDLMQVTAPHPGYLVDKDEAWGYLVDGMQQICMRAGELGIKIVIEPLTFSEGGNLLTSVDDVLKLMKDVGEKSLYSMIDVVPPFIANEPFSEYFDKLGEKMCYLHICNNDGVTEIHTHLDDPNGQIPLLDFFRIVKRYNYVGWASVELLAPYFRDPELYLAGSMRTLNNIFGELGITRN